MVGSLACLLWGFGQNQILEANFIIILIIISMRTEFFSINIIIIRGATVMISCCEEKHLKPFAWYPFPSQANRPTCQHTDFTCIYISFQLLNQVETHVGEPEKTFTFSSVKVILFKYWFRTKWNVVLLKISLHSACILLQKVCTQCSGSQLRIRYWQRGQFWGIFCRSAQMHYTRLEVYGPHGPDF